MYKLVENIFEWERPLKEGKNYLFRLLEIILAGQIIIKAWDWSVYIYDLTEVILPLGIANYIDMTLFFGNSLSLINATLITLFLVIGFTRKWRYSYLIALILYHFQYAARFSQGEISHGANMGAMMLLSMGISFAFFKSDEDAIKSSFGLIYFFVGLGYVSAALSKLIGTGFYWSHGDHLRMWIAERGTDKLSQFGYFKLNFLQEFLLKHTWAATLTLSFGLLVEFFGFLLWFRKTRWIQTTLLLSMHFGILWTMNIYFSDYVYLLLIIGYPWDILLEKLSIRVHKAKLDAGVKTG